MSASEASAGLVHYSTTGTHAFAQPLPTRLARHGAQAFLRVERSKYRLRRMKSGVITAARLMDAQFQARFSRRGRKGYKAAFCTLTYAPGHNWRPDHIKATLQACRKWCDRQGVKCAYVWTAELQKRGVVHYHIVFWLPRHLNLPMFDRRGWWPYGSSNIKEAQKPVGYLAKYASKGEDSKHEFPKGCRIHGAGGLSDPARIEARWWRASKDARELFGNVVSNVKRITGGWVLVDETSPVRGLMWRTPWRMVRVNGDFVLTKANLEEHEDANHRQ